MTLDNLRWPCRFRMGCAERGDLGGVGLSRVRVGCRRHHVIVERLGRGEREHGHIDHGCPPFFSVRKMEEQTHTARGGGVVRGVGIGASQRESPKHGNVARRKDGGLREAHALTIAVEESTESNPLCVVTAKAGIESPRSLEFIDESRRCDLMGSQPAAQIDKGNTDNEDGGGHSA